MATDRDAMPQRIADITAPTVGTADSPAHGAAARRRRPGTAFFGLVSWVR
eukprot:COSAG03_NODE_15126_length_440_cov_1.516129_2_plen_49_part_01